MAAAKKCDVCKAFFDPYNVKKDPKNVNGIMFLNIDEKGLYFQHQTIDCCPKCISEIHNCIRRLKNE